MKKLLVHGASLVALTMAVSATPVLLNTTPLPGTQASSQGDAVVAAWLNSLAGTSFTGSDVSVNNNNTGAPTGYPNFGPNTNPITLPVGDYDYLVLHWGGSGGGVDYAYDLTACADGSTFTFAPLDGRNNGLSSYRFYGPNGSVPDTGSTLALLGLGVCLIGAAKRRL